MHEDARALSRLRSCLSSATPALEVMPVSETVTVGEAAKRLGCSPRLVYSAVRRGELPVIRLGRRVLIPQAGLDRLLDVDRPSHESA